MSVELLSPLGADSLDIDKIRDKFKQYLLDEKIIKDVSYLGSNASQLIDIIAYAIQSINATNALTNNQNILSLSQVRSNIVQLGNQLGYNITRVISAKMKVTFSFDIVDGQYITIPKYTKFNAGEFAFITENDVLLTHDNNAITTNVTEGVVIDDTIDSKLHYTITDSMYRFILNYRHIENSSVKVYIKKANNDIWDDDWKRANSLTELESGKKLYYEEYQPDTGWINIYTSFAGNGYTLTEGDEIKFEFILSEGSKGNGLASLSFFDEVIVDNNGELVEPIITINNKSIGGQDEESDQSIKDNAPLFYNTGMRAANEYDYESFLTKSSLVDVSVAWGGEKMPVEKRGYIYVSAVPQDSNKRYLSNLEIVSLMEMLSNVRILSTHRIFWQPVYLDVSFKIKILGDATKISDKQNEVSTSLTKYFNNNITTFKSSLYKNKILLEIEKVFQYDANASVTVDITPSILLTTELFGTNLTDDKLTMQCFIPTTKSKYYLIKDGIRINVPDEDKDLIDYILNGWVRVYEKDEDIDVSFKANKVNGNVNESIITVDDNIIYQHGVTQTMIGNYDKVNSVLYLKREYFDDTLKIIDFVVDEMPKVDDRLITDDGSVAKVLRVDIDAERGSVGRCTIIIVSGDFEIDTEFDVGDVFTVSNNNKVIDIKTNKLIDINITNKLNIEYDPFFNVQCKHNVNPVLGDITWI